MPVAPPLAILGGTFDPVHYGHLRFADEVRRALHLPLLMLVPAGDPPHRSGPAASARDRLAMLELAITEFPGLAIDDRELHRDGKSFTVLTLEELRREYPDRPLWLLVGADAFSGFPQWHRWREIFALAHVIVVARPGVALESELPTPLAAEWNARLIGEPGALYSSPAGAIYVQPISPQPISATAIRAQLARGQAGRTAVAQLLPRAVLAYIDQHRLYSPPPDAP